jgi:hypothetical protein
MKTFVPHFEVLPDKQKVLWHGLAPCKELGFALYGGTAIALQLGHRASIDFDFFSHTPLNDIKESDLLTALPFLKSAQQIQKAQNTRSFLTESGVKLSFLGEIRFGRIGEPRLTSDGVLQVASLDDLMATKLAVIMQRVEAKDYKDIAAMLRNGVSLERGLAGAAALYGAQFPPSESVRAMTYFQGGDLQELQTLDRDILLSAVKKLPLRELPKVELLSVSLVADEREYKAF